MPTLAEEEPFTEWYDKLADSKPLTTGKFIATAARAQRSGLAYANMSFWPVARSRLDPERQSPYVNGASPLEWRGNAHLPEMRAQASKVSMTALET